MDILHYGFTTWILIRRWIQKAKDKESNKPAQWEEKGVCEGKKKVRREFVKVKPTWLFMEMENE